MVSDKIIHELQLFRLFNQIWSNRVRLGILACFHIKGRKWCDCYNLINLNLSRPLINIVGFSLIKLARITSSEEEIKLSVVSLCGR